MFVCTSSTIYNNNNRLFVYTSEIETFRVQAVTISHTPDSTQPRDKLNNVLKTCSDVRHDCDETAIIFIAIFFARDNL